MDAIAEKVIEGLSSLALEEFNLLHNLKDDKKRIEQTVSAIKAAIRKAEANATNDPQVSDWLEKLQEVLYDADDLLDDFSAEALAKKVMTGFKIAKEVRIFFSNSNQLVYGHKMSRKMEEIRKKLDEIAEDKNNLKLPFSSREPIEEKENRQTHSFVREDEVIGRDVEKNKILSYLLDTNVEDDVSVITIVGIGGLGKTCLARLVYNDVSIKNYFELKMWVCVSVPFDIRAIGQKMVGCETNANIEEVQEKLRDKIRGRRFLLVLDDVWSEDRNLWLDLKSMLMEGQKGSMVIITTRNTSVAEMTGACISLNLKGLDEKKSWNLFSQLAFKDGKVSDDPELLAIAEEICRKCVGVPLAIRTMANLLYSTKSDWSFIRDNELLSRDQENNKILDILRLSYDHLSSNLKNCFAYCSLFPKDFEINKKTLIQLWIAQGFIPSPNQNKFQEDVAHDYFMNLLSRCFFQDMVTDEFGNIESCKMHDLIHDLATLVSNNEYTIISEENLQIIEEMGDGNVILGEENKKIIGGRKGEIVYFRDENKEIIGDKVRHLYMDVPWGFVWKVPTSLLEGRKLRTYFLPEDTIEWEESSECLGCYGRRGRWSRTVACNRGMFSTSSLPIPWGLERLRVLHHSNIQQSVIPESIEKLKHLRYLDFSHSHDIKKLPRSITRLHNLQTLKLNYCLRLEELPRDINKMVSLRHLELDGCTSLDWIPQGLGQLTALQTMTQFGLNPTKSDSARLSELGGLNNLKGRLSIYDLQQVRGNPEEAESAKLLRKQRLQHLELYWQDAHRSVEHKEEDHHKDQMLLQALQPHPSIKSLRISGCFIKMFPGWIRNLSSLQMLCLDGLYSASIPDGIEILSSLQKLVIKDCHHLEYLPESIGNLSSLKQLQIDECDRLASLPESIGNLSSLQQLQINYCNHLVSLPESVGNLLSLQQLELGYCNRLTSLPNGMSNIRSLQRLRIYHCPRLEERCIREEGMDWQKIAHVPNVSFDLSCMD